MPVATVQIQSSALERLVTYTVLLPDMEQAGPGPYDVLLQLHGRYDDHTSWLHKSNLVGYTSPLPFVVILPDGANMMWGNLYPEMLYEDFLIQDLRQQVENIFAVKKGSRWALGGLSMGGFGAIRLALKYPEKFFSIYAHSSYIPTQEEIRENITLPDSTITDLDCYRWAEQISPAQLPTFSFDCGTEDGLIEHNRRFHAHLGKLGIPHNYFEYPGAHTWDYWDQHVQTALKQHLERMKDKG